MLYLSLFIYFVSVQETGWACDGLNEDAPYRLIGLNTQSSPPSQLAELFGKD